MFSKHSHLQSFGILVLRVARRPHDVMRVGCDRAAVQLPFCGFRGNLALLTRTSPNDKNERSRMPLLRDIGLRMGPRVPSS